MIKVVDSIMGSGKTSAAIELMNSDKEHNYIYITPYLSEIERIKEQTERNFYEPKIYSKNGETFFKLDSLHELLTEGKNICTTHALFKNANDVTRDLLESSNYILILDEVMEVVKELPVKSKDVDMLFNEGWIYKENDLVLWNTEKEKNEGEYNGVFKQVKRMALNKNLIIHNKTILMWTFPSEIFELFEDVFVLTYLFDAQIQKYYYDLNSIEYDKYIATKDEWNRYIFKPRGEYSDKELKNSLKQLINIYEGNLNKIGDKDYSLSKSWYDNKRHMHKKMKNNVENYFRNIVKSKSNDNMWTVFKDFESKIKGKGYTKGFVSCNTRATNDFAHKTALTYTINRFLHPVIEGYFKSNNVEINEDLYALSELIQWIWRSAIRNNEEINIYIPSMRMRTLQIQWLNDEI